MKAPAHTLIMLLAVVFTVGSCSVNGDIRLARGLLDSSPDSALVVLDRISPEELSPSDRAEYAYVSASAFYRSYYFLDDEHSKALEQAYWYKERQRSRLASLALLITGILASLVLYFWARKSQAQKELLIQRQENDLLLSTAEDLRSRLGALRKSSGADVFDTLDRLCEQYYIYEGTENLQPRILREVRSIVEGLRADPAMRRTLEQNLDRLHDGVMTKLRAAFPRWKEEDFALYAFTAAGFSSTTISTLMEKDKPYVYNRLYRLKERIRNSGVEGADAFLSLL